MLQKRNLFSRDRNMLPQALNTLEPLTLYHEGAFAIVKPSTHYLRENGMPKVIQVVLNAALIYINFINATIN